jgi:hypothetical protein
MSTIAARIASIAWASVTPSAVPNERVVDTMPSRWAMDSGITPSSTRAKLASGDRPPSEVTTRIELSADRSCARAGSTSSTTLYWFSGSYSVLIWRWPKASYSAWFTVPGVRPSRASVSRSYTSRVCAARSS